MDATHLLEKNCEALLALYEEHISDIQDLRNILRDELLPQMAEDLGLPDDDVVWAREWLDDPGTSLYTRRIDQA